MSKITKEMLPYLGIYCRNELSPETMKDVMEILHDLFLDYPFDRAYLFGSFAHGTPNHRSDYNFLLVGNEFVLDRNALSRYSFTVRPTMYSRPVSFMTTAFCGFDGRASHPTNPEFYMKNYGICLSDSKEKPFKRDFVMYENDNPIDVLCKALEMNSNYFRQKKILPEDLAINFKLALMVYCEKKSYSRCCCEESDAQFDYVSLFAEDQILRAIRAYKEMITDRKSWKALSDIVYQTVAYVLEMPHSRNRATEIYRFEEPSKNKV